MNTLQTYITATDSFDEYLDIVASQTAYFVKNIDNKKFSETMHFFGELVEPVIDAVRSGQLAWSQEKVSGLNIFSDYSMVEDHKYLDIIGRTKISEAIIKQYDAHATFDLEITDAQKKQVFHNFTIAMADGIASYAHIVDSGHEIPDNKLVEKFDLNAHIKSKVNKVRP